MSNHTENSKVTAPKVSIIIPARNEEKSLPIVINALKNQTLAPFQIIVVDSASTDKTGEVGRSLGAEVIREERIGTNNALETGRSLAKGEFLARIDADCIPEKDWVEKAIKIFEDEKVVCVTGPYDYYDSEWVFRNLSYFAQKYIYFCASIFMRVFNLGGIIIEGNSMMRTATMQKIGGFNRDIIFYGDGTDLAKNLCKHGKVIFNRHLAMKTSARRFKNEGTLKVSIKYIKEFLKVVIKPSKL